MYPMDKNSERMWRKIILEARQGNKNELERLTTENQLRKENKQPTVEEELNNLTKGEIPEMRKTVALHLTALNSFSPDEKKIFMEIMNRTTKKKN